jgi:hypothetical protein
VKKLSNLFTILFILWLFGVFGLFYVIQKPFTPAAAQAIVNALLDLLVAVWLGLLGLGVGHRLLGWLQTLAHAIVPTVQPISPTRSGRHHDLEASTGEILILGTGLGLGALGLMALGLGLVGLFYRWLFLAMSVLLTVLLWPDFRALRRRLAGWPPPDARPQRLTAIYVIVVALFTLITALLPPIDWDGLFYHLTAPKLFIQLHRLTPGIDVPHFNFPFLAEMLFAYGMLLRGDISAKLIHTGYGLLLAGLVYLIARRCLSRESAWSAVLIFLSMPMVSTLAGWAYNDLALAFYQLAALYALLRSQRSDVRSQKSDTRLPITNYQPGWLMVSGLLAGLAMGLKYTSFVAPLTLGLILIWWLVKSQVAANRRPMVEHPSHNLHAHQMGSLISNTQWAQCLPSPISNLPSPRAEDILKVRHSLFAIRYSPFAILSFALPALLVALPWYLKNYFFTGNPFYPFAAGWFDGWYWDQFRATWYAQAGTGIGFDLPKLLGLPFLATLGVKDVNYFDGRTGPLFLAFLPLLLLYGLFRYRASLRPPALDALLIFALAQFIFWAAGVVWSRSLWQSRLLLPCLAALSPVVGWLWQDLKHLDRPGFSIRRFANLLLSLVLALNLVELSLAFIQVNPLAYLSGRESRSEYLTRRLGAYYVTIERLNQTLPPSADVLFLWEPRTYFCQITCRPDSILDQLAHDQHVFGNAAAIAAAWKKAGITHVLLHRQGLDFIKSEGAIAGYAPALKELATLETQYFEPVFDVAGAYQLYKLRY